MVNYNLEGPTCILWKILGRLVQNQILHCHHDNLVLHLSQYGILGHAWLTEYLLIIKNLRNSGCRIFWRKFILELGNSFAEYQFPEKSRRAPEYQSTIDEIGYEPTSGTKGLKKYLFDPVSEERLSKPLSNTWTIKVRAFPTTTTKRCADKFGTSFEVDRRGWLLTALYSTCKTSIQWMCGGQCYINGMALDSMRWWCRLG